jgi:LysM repeat protein
MRKLKFLTPLLALGLIIGSGFSSVGGDRSTVTVEEGDTLWSIAEAHEGVTIYDLYEWNLSLDPYSIPVGTEVIVDPGSDYYHTVSAGETFYSIAQLYNDVELADLYALNPHIDPYNLQIGSEVRISGIPVSGKHYTIQPGDTLFSIAVRQPGITLAELYELNPGVDPVHLQIGSQIRVK